MFYKCLIREDVPVVSALFERHVVLLKAKEKFCSYWHGQSQSYKNGGETFMWKRA